MKDINHEQKIEEYTEAEKLVNTYNLPEKIVHRAWDLCSLVSGEVINETSLKTKIMGALYIACRQYGCEKNLEEFAQLSGVSTQELRKMYWYFIQKLGIRLQAGHPIEYLPLLVSALSIGEQTQLKALELLERIETSEKMKHRHSKGIAAAALYAATLLNNEQRSQREIGDILEITETAIRTITDEIALLINHPLRQQNISRYLQYKRRR